MCMHKTIVATKDHYVGPYKTRVIWTNVIYQIIAESDNKIMVRVGEKGVFGWTDKDKF